MGNQGKTIGMLGGMAWPSARDYYSLLNLAIEKKYGANHSAQCILYSYDSDKVNANYRTEEEIVTELEKGIAVLLTAGADALLICSNTTHKYFDRIKHNYTASQFIDIRDCIGTYMAENNIAEALLLGTQFTMSGEFNKPYINTKYSVNITSPDAQTREQIHQYIFKELVNNIITAEAVNYFKRISESEGAVILGCTELRLIFDKLKTNTLIIDSTEIHVSNAIKIVYEES